jgi:hypothetical protein
VGRVAALDVNDPDAELSTQERGSVLFGVEFDPQRDCVEIILGEANGRRRRLTRVIPNPSALCELLGPSGDEEGLHIAHGTGETLLTILSPGSYSKS